MFGSDDCRCFRNSPDSNTSKDNNIILGSYFSRSMRSTTRSIMASTCEIKDNNVEIGHPGANEQWDCGVRGNLRGALLCRTWSVQSFLWVGRAWMSFPSWPIWVLELSFHRAHSQFVETSPGYDHRGRKRLPRAMHGKECGDASPVRDV